MDCSVYLSCKTIPIIESSCGMKFGPFNGGLEGHGDLLREAGLNNTASTSTSTSTSSITGGKRTNEWFKVYDFSAENAGNTGGNITNVQNGNVMNASRHWRIMKREEEDDLWCPLGPAENCIPRVDPDDGVTTDKREDRGDREDKDDATEEEADMCTSRSSVGSTPTCSTRGSNNDDAEVMKEESRKRPEFLFALSFTCFIIFSWVRRITETISTSVNAMYDEMKSKTATISSRVISCVSCIANKKKKE